MTLAGVAASGRGSTDRLLESVVSRLTGEGFRILGALRAIEPDGGSGDCNSALRLLPEGPVVTITQELGAGSTACRMDAGALEEAVGLAAARLIGEGGDLFVLNKFGLSEAEGRGFRALIADAIGRGMPVLVGLSDTHRAAFERFAGGLAAILPPDEEAVTDWCRTAIARRTGIAHVA